MRGRDCLLVILIFGLLACKTDKTWDKSSDLIFVSEFTKGLEGPAVDSEGNLFFVNPLRNGTIGKVNSEGNIFELAIDSLPNGSIANGIRFNQRGDMFMADYINHNILKIDAISKELSILAHDSTMNQPNDLAITSTGILFASDPNWDAKTGRLWRVDLDGKLSLLESNMGTTNGVEVAPGDSILYVNESKQFKVWKYSLDSDGDISNKQLFYEFEGYGLDGMRCDLKGNLYVTRYDKGTVAVISPNGELMREVELTAQKPTNIAFGGADGRTCFITCQDRGYIETFTAAYPGRSWELAQRN